MEQQINIEVIRRYLLGASSEAERQRVEESYLADDEYFEGMLSVEDDLLDAFARGALSPRESELFQSNYLNSAARHERVAFARQLAGYDFAAPKNSPREKPRPAGSFWSIFFNFNPLAARLAFALAAVAMLAGGFWLIGETRRLRAELARGEAEKAQLREQERKLNEQLIAERTLSAEAVQSLDVERKTREILEADLAAEKKTPTAVAPSSGSQNQLASFLLVPGLVRANAGGRQLSVPANARRVEFRLNFTDGAYSLYSASLQTPEGKELWRQNDLRARPRRSGQIVAFNLPAARLASGDYVITLRGANADGTPEDVSDYAFRLVVKK